MRFSAGMNFLAKPDLPPKVAIEEVGHHVVRLFRFGPFPLVPEGVSQTVENDQLRVDSRVHEGAVQVHRVAVDQVTSAGEEWRRRESLEVGVDRRKAQGLSDQSTRCTRCRACRSSD